MKVADKVPTYLSMQASIEDIIATKSRLLHWQPAVISAITSTFISRQRINIRTVLQNKGVWRLSVSHIPNCLENLSSAYSSGYEPAPVESVPAESAGFSIVFLETSSSKAMHFRLPASFVEDDCLYCRQCQYAGPVMSLCGKCKSVRYCSIDCQKRAWSAHKKNCKK